MHKKLALSIAALAIMALSACDESKPSCKTDSQKCASNSIYTCIDGIWEVTKACTEAEVCSAPTFVCEAKATCINGTKRCNGANIEVCFSDLWQFDSACKDPSVCDENSLRCETPTETCETGAKRCENNKLYTCSDKGLWTMGQACETGKECVNDATQCTDIGDGTCKGEAAKCVGKNHMNCVDDKWAVTQCASACDANTGCVECIKDAHCPTQKGACQNMQCYACKSTDITCIDSIYRHCNADQSAYETTDCAQNQTTPHCLAQAGCVECRDEKDCIIGQDCNANHTCSVPSTPSNITACKSIQINEASRSSTGRVLDARSPKDADTITAILLCGKAGQKLTEYQKMIGSFNPNCPDCADTFEYRASIDKVFDGTYLCLWSFSLPDQKTVACKKDGSLITDLDSVPSENDALSYTFVWDQVIDFENFKINENYQNEETVIVGDIKTAVTGAIFGPGSNGSIDSKSVVLSDKYGGIVDINQKYEDTYVGLISFEYRAYKGDDFGADSTRELNLYLEWDPDIIHTIALDDKLDTVQTVVLPINRKARGFQLITQPLMNSGNAPRLLIDNVRWTTHK